MATAGSVERGQRRDVDDDVDAARLRILSSSREQNAAWNWAKLSTTTHRGAGGSLPNPRSAPRTL